MYNRPDPQGLGKTHPPTEGGTLFPSLLQFVLRTSQHAWLFHAFHIRDLFQDPLRHIFFSSAASVTPSVLLS